MRILLNSINCGLGNNGGSATLVRSANILHQLGHDVIIVDTIGNRHLWTPLEAGFKKIHKIGHFPSGDVVIATGYNTWNQTLDLPERCGKKFVWVRGWEIWNAPEEKIVKILSDSRFIKIVNSICLQEKLKQHGISSHIIRPGYDFDELYPENIRDSKNVVLGGIFNKGSKRAGKRTEWIFETARFIKKNYPYVKLFMFGTDGVPNNDLVDIFVKEPDIKRKNDLYNQMSILLSPTKLEGLHIVPAEAMLTECCVVGTNAPMSGMQDYLINNETGIVTENNLTSFINGVEELVIMDEIRNTLGLAARDKILSLGSREMNMQRFVDLLKEFV